MTQDPHPTPEGPDPDARTEVHPVAPDPFAPPATEPADVEVSDPVESPDASGTDPGAGTIDPPPAEAPEEPVPTHPVGEGDDWLQPDAATSAATPGPDPLIATPAAFTPPGTPEDDAPSAVDQGKERAQEAQAKVQETAQQAQAKAQEAQAKVQETAQQAQVKVQETAQVAQAKARELKDRPEAMVGLAFVGGAVVSFVLRALRR